MSLRQYQSVTSRDIVERRNSGSRRCVSVTANNFAFAMRGCDLIVDLGANDQYGGGGVVRDHCAGLLDILWMFPAKFDKTGDEHTIIQDYVKNFAGQCEEFGPDSRAVAS